MNTSISEAEQKFIVAGVRENVRGDGRGRLDYRLVSIECGVLPQANGSARLTLESANTQVLASVKVELVKPPADAPATGTAECNVECWTSASAKFAGRGAVDINSELSSTLNQVLVTSGALDLRRLCIVPRRFAWHVAIDVVVLEAGGSLVDALVLAAVAALGNARVPRLRLLAGEAADDVDVEIDDDNAAGEETPLPIDADALPIALTFTQIGGLNVVDATLEEEACATSRVIVAVNKRSEVCCVISDGEGGVPPPALHAAAEVAVKLAPALLDHVAAAVSVADGEGEEGTATGGAGAVAASAAGGGRA